MRFQGTFTRALQGDFGRWEVTFTTHDRESAMKLKTQDNTKQLAIDVVEWREKRSKDANAYFHALVDKIAKKLGQSLDDVKKRMVCDYGAVACIARIPASANLDNIYKYTKMIGESKGTKEPCNDWYIFKPTHTLDTKEMATLIDGVVQEAQQLDIETKTPQQIAELVSLWGQEQ